MSSVQRNRTIRFAAFEVDPASGELRKQGIRIRLQEQPFKILLALVEKPGEVVTRDELRKRIWGDGTFVDFDHGLNAAINRLRDALGDSAENPRYIETMARRGYRFIAPVEGVPMPVAPAATLGRPRRKLFWAAIALAVAIVAGVGVWLVRDDGAPQPAPRVERLTAFAGVETQPAFSPDGRHVAFAWDGEKQDNFDIYVKMVGSPTALRLTSDPGIDQFPAWSPDGRQIAFASSRGQAGIYLVAPLGGTERKLSDLDIRGRPSWSPDGRLLAVTRSYDEHSNEPDNGAVLLIPVETNGEPRRILVPQPGTWYAEPLFSPDGRRLAVDICTGAYQAGAPVCQLHVLALNAELVPQGEPRAVTQGQPPSMGALLRGAGLAWTAKGDSLVATASLVSPEPWLWRVPAGEPAEPQRLEAAGPASSYPAIDAHGRRLAFTHNLSRREIWRWKPGGKPAAFLTSSVRDASPQFSHDGQRIAFESRRGGDEIAVWVADLNGTGLTQITKGASSYCGTPRWSPDDRWIAFDAWGKNGRWDIWVVEASGGPPRRLTQGPADNTIPSWSHDGRWVYFSSNRSGRLEIWRAPAQAGPAEQVTWSGGYVGLESTDGKTLYYTKSEYGAEGLFAMQLAGGAERQVLKNQVIVRGFAVFPDGIYYLSPRVHNNPSVPWVSASLSAQPSRQSFRWNEIRFHEFASGRSWTTVEIEGPLALGLSVSPDRKTFLFARFIAAADLMLIENFR